VSTIDTIQGRKLGPTPPYPASDEMPMAPNASANPVSKTPTPTSVCAQTEAARAGMGCADVGVDVGS